MKKLVKTLQVHQLVKNKIKVIYLSGNHNGNLKEEKHRLIKLSNLIEGVKHRYYNTFFPVDYPNSVKPEYYQIVKWQFIHSIFATTSGVLSTQSLLLAVGLSSGVIPTAAALNWIIKDGVGQLGGVIYASFVSKRFDSGNQCPICFHGQEPKKFRFKSAFSMHLASFMDISTLLFPSYFIYIASISNIWKNISWLSASATRAQINQQLSCRDNLGDITAKAVSQSTAAGIIGTSLGVGLCHLIGNDIFNIMAAYSSLSLISLAAIYTSCSHVICKSLNSERLEIILASCISQSKLNLELMKSPAEVASMESIIKSRKSPFLKGLYINSEISHNLNLYKSFNQLDFLNSEMYYIYESPSAVHLWLNRNAQGQDIIKGFVHSCLVRRLSGEKSTPSIQETHSYLNENLPTIMKRLEELGWDTQDLSLLSSNNTIDQIIEI